MNFNKAIIAGRLTNDPDRRSLPSGDPVVSFSMATNRYYTTQGQKKEEVEFHNVVMFGKMAEIAAQYLKKGSLALIEGRIKTRNWQDQQGLKHTRTEIIAESLQLGPRAQGQGGGSNYQPKTYQAGAGSPTPTPQMKNTIKEEEIPVIQEDEPITAKPGESPFEDEDKDEINVKDIPF